MSRSFLHIADRVSTAVRGILGARAFEPKRPRRVAMLPLYLPPKELPLKSGGEETESKASHRRPAPRYARGQNIHNPVKAVRAERCSAS